MADVTKIKLPSGAEYNIKDTISGYVASDEVSHIYVQASEPADAQNGDIWIDTDEDSTPRANGESF